MLEERIINTGIDIKRAKYIGSANFTHSDTSGEEHVSFYRDTSNALYQEVCFIDPFDQSASAKTSRCALDTEEVKRLVALRNIRDYRRFYWDV